MIEIAGLIISGISLLKDLQNIFKDLNSWEEKDLVVDMEWVPLAIKKGILPGNESEYVWKRLENVSTLDLKGSHQVVIAHNDDKKTYYRIMQGPPHDLLVLMKKLPPD